MYTRITLGRLMASLDASVTLNGVPLDVPALVQMLVPACRMIPDRPGSIWNVMVAGTAPLETVVTSAWLLVATLNVSLPLPRLLTLMLDVATPRWQSSMARNT